MMMAMPNMMTMIMTTNMIMTMPNMLMMMTTKIMMMTKMLRMMTTQIMMMTTKTYEDDDGNDANDATATTIATATAVDASKVPAHCRWPLSASDMQGQSKRLCTNSMCGL